MAIDLRRLLGLRPGSPAAPAAAALEHYQRGNDHRKAGNWAAALAEYDQAIALDAGSARTWCNRAVALERLGRRDDALASYERACAIDPADALACCNRGTLLAQLGRNAEAIDWLERAIVLQPDLPEAHYNRASLLHQMHRWPEAAAGLERAISLNPALATRHALVMIVGARREMRDWQGMLAAADRALQGDAHDVDALLGRAQSLHELKRYDEAVAAYDAAQALRQDFHFLAGMRADAAMQCCAWGDRDRDIAGLEAGISAGLPTSPPFPLLALLDSAPLQRRAAEIWVRDRFPPQPVAMPQPPRSGRIRVGYFSADFRLHPVTLLLIEILEMHDRSRFETTAFAFGPRPDEAIGARIARAFDRFVDVRSQSDEEVAALARRLGIDIAIDLSGYTEHNRAGIFALRAAPLQVSYLGFLGTMGAPYIDYLIADETIVPEADRAAYSEKILYLPTYQANPARRVSAAHTFSREELRLPAHGFVFCCCNSSYKISPATFDSWMRILARVGGSVLLLTADNELAAGNLRREAVRRGIAAERIVFAGRLPLPEYLARYRSLDLFLDTSPYNAGTTAADALWSGLPVLTRLGTTFAGRMAASIVRAAGLPELVTRGAAEYEDLAVALATDPARLAGLRARLADQRDRVPLFDARAFVAHLEAAYQRIHDRRLAGQAPDHLLP